MKKNIRKVVELQELELKLRKYKVMYKKENKKQEAVETDLNYFLGEIDGLKEQIKSLQANHNLKELELKELEQSLAKKHEKRGVAKDSREYEALSREIKYVENDIGALEENILLLLEDIDRYKKTLSEKKGELRIKQEKFEKLQVFTKERIGKLKKNLTIIKKKIKITTEKLSEEEINFYEDLKKTLRLPVIILLRDEVCAGCGSDFPGSDLRKIKNSGELSRCKSCGRILIWDGAKI